VRLLLVVGETRGGIGRHVGLLADRLPGHGVDVVVAGPLGSLAAMGRIPGPAAVAVETGRLRPLRVWKTVQTLRNLARSADVVHAHGLRAASASVATRSGRPVVVTWHNALLTRGPRRWAQRTLARYAARRADVTLAASDDLADEARRAGARDVRTTFVTAPSLPPPTRDRAAVRTELGVVGRALVVAVGRLQAQKRLDVLVEAAAAWTARSDAPVVVIAGEGPDRAALQRRIERSGAPVCLLGARSDVPDLLAAADVVVLPSAWEARSLVAQEALRAGVPLVATPVGGLPQLLGRAAAFVPVGDPAALRAAVERILADPAIAARMVDLGRQRAQTWPNEAATLAELRGLYIDLNQRSIL
jgi:glycosyltransferase involved in cell wall biosynthesis